MIEVRDIPDFNDYLESLLVQNECDDLEFKSAAGGFPGNFWDTYSAFANSEGGTIVLGVQEKKGHDITFINLDKLEYATTTGFVLATGNTKIQVEAIADSVREYVQEKTGQKPYNYDGYQNSQWIVIDYGTIFAHIFLPEERER